MRSSLVVRASDCQCTSCKIRIPNPDPDPLTRLNPDPIRIRNPVYNTDGKYYCWHAGEPVPAAAGYAQGGGGARDGASLRAVLLQPRQEGQKKQLSHFPNWKVYQKTLFYEELLLTSLIKLQHFFYSFTSSCRSNVFKIYYLATFSQCCGSGMFIPDPNFSIPDPGSKDFGSRIRILIKEFKYF